MMLRPRLSGETKWVVTVGGGTGAQPVVVRMEMVTAIAIPWAKPLLKGGLSIIESILAQLRKRDRDPEGRGLDGQSPAQDVEEKPRCGEGSKQLCVYPLPTLHHQHRSSES